MKKKIDISIIIPTYNEEDNVSLLHKEIVKALDQTKYSYEIVFIDDGSTDNTLKELNELKRKDKKVVIIKFRGNFGQTAAMDAGFKNANGNILIPMDADLQNDPSDISNLVKKINEGYDVVAGWRKYRKDPLMKKFISRGANLLRKILLNDGIHDSGCTLKAYRKECFNDLDLYGEMHRFIPIILQWRGFKVTEIVVKHHPRRFGKTKYGITRVIKGLLDMLVVKFWMQYSARPMHLFGGLGIMLGFLGVITGGYITIMKFFYMQSADRPLLLLSSLLMILGFLFLMFGVLADILVKIYYKDKEVYNIEKIY